MKPIRNKYVASLDQKGFPGEQMVSEAAKIVEKYNKKKYEPWKFQRSKHVTAQKQMGKPNR